MDDDLNAMSREELIAEVKKLRTGIREHRDSSGHNLCWHHPELWGLLPEPVPQEIAVPPWPKFMAGCVAYRRSLDKELPDAPIDDEEYENKSLDLIKTTILLFSVPGFYHAQLLTCDLTRAIFLFGQNLPAIAEVSCTFFTLPGDSRIKSFAHMTFP